MLKMRYAPLLLVLFIVGCTQEDLTDTPVNTTSHSELIHSFATEIKEMNKRPYFEGDTYYTINDEVSLLSHEWETDREGHPTLILWLTYTNIGEDAFPPMAVRGRFNFFQNGQEIEETFASLSKKFSQENPQYEKAYQVAIQPLPPGETVTIYMAIPLEDENDVTLTFEEKTQQEDQASLLFHFNDTENFYSSKTQK